MKNIKLLLLLIFTTTTICANAQISAIMAGTDAIEEALKTPGAAARLGIKSIYPQSEYEVYMSQIGQYMKQERTKFAIIKLGTTSTMGGYSVYLEKSTDLDKNTSAKAIRIEPNSTKGVVNKIAGKVTVGIAASAKQIYFIDPDEVEGIKAVLAQMKEYVKSEPNSNVSYNYTCRGALSIGCDYTHGDKDGKWKGHFGEVSDIPIKDFFSETNKVIILIEELIDKM